MLIGLIITMAETERLFFALWPEAQQQQDWADLAKNLIPAGSGRLIHAQNLHLTLVYLGEITIDVHQRLEQLADAIHSASFELKLERFGHWSRPQVLWWGPKQTPVRLIELVESLRRAARACDIEVEQRPYAAHMTLARKVRRAPGRLTAEPHIWQVDEFALVRSTLLPEGAEYEVVRRWPLKPA